MTSIDVFYRVRPFVWKSRLVGKWANRVGQLVDYRYGDFPIVLDMRGVIVAFREDEVDRIYNRPYVFGGGK